MADEVAPAVFGRQLEEMGCEQFAGQPEDCPPGTYFAESLQGDFYCCPAPAEPGFISESSADERVARAELHAIAKGRKSMVGWIVGASLVAGALGFVAGRYVR